MSFIENKEYDVFFKKDHKLNLWSAHIEDIAGCRVQAYTLVDAFDHLKKIFEELTGVDPKENNIIFKAKAR